MRAFLLAVTPHLSPPHQDAMEGHSLVRISTSIISTSHPLIIKVAAYPPHLDSSKGFRNANILNQPIDVQVFLPGAQLLRIGLTVNGCTSNNQSCSA